MNLSRTDLLSLEEYSETRQQFRTEVMAHKKIRLLKLGNHIALIFEDRLTVQYQIQEMLRIEKVFESSGIQEELDAYNPLIPDGNNWKCTLMIQYEDIEERRQRLRDLVGVEDKVWIQIDESPKVYPVADEDLERANEEKTSAVHFLRYPLTAEMIEQVKSGCKVHAGVDHPEYPLDPVEMNQQMVSSLVADLN